MCGPGEPYDPLDVTAATGRRADRGASRPVESHRSGQDRAGASDLVDRFEYHLDFPGDPLDAGCDYELWARRLAGERDPVVYAHVATEPGYPGKLALQYWFFYPFNDFNNTHEGDWEMIQLVFDASDAREALDREPALVGYSSHEGAESAEWDDEKLTIVDGTHPVVYPGAGSHANKFTEALYLGSSAEAGVGCDDTRGPHRELRPVVQDHPGRPGRRETGIPVDRLRRTMGRAPAGVLQRADRPQPEAAVDASRSTWSEGWRDQSYAVPSGGLFGTSATDLFCSGVEKGSRGLILLLRSPGLMLLLLAAVLGLVVFVAVRATWSPVAPLRLGRRRTWGQILSASGRMYVKRAPLFLGIGLLLIPIAFAITFLQWLVFAGLDVIGVSTTGESAGGAALLAVVIGTTLALLGLGLVQAATACALVEIDQGRPVGPAPRVRDRVQTDPTSARRGRALRARLGGADHDGDPDPRRALARRALVPARAHRRARGSARDRAALRRSRELVRRRWWRTASLVGVSAVPSRSPLGPLLGALLIFVIDAPLAMLNIVAGLVYAARCRSSGLSPLRLLRRANARRARAGDRRAGAAGGDRAVQRRPSGRRLAAPLLGRPGRVNLGGSAECRPRSTAYTAAVSRDPTGPERPHERVAAAGLGAVAAAQQRAEALVDAVGVLAVRAVDHVVLTGERVTSAAEGRRLLTDPEDVEALAGQIQRVVVLAVPVVRVLARGARFTRVPWVMLASTATSVGLAVRTGVRELQVVAALVAHRLEQATGTPADPALVKKLAVDLYLDPKRTPDLGNDRVRLVRLTRRWVLRGAFGRDTAKLADRALGAAERLDVRAAHAAWRVRKP